MGGGAAALFSRACSGARSRDAPPSSFISFLLSSEPLISLSADRKSSASERRFAAGSGRVPSGVRRASSAGLGDGGGGAGGPGASEATGGGDASCRVARCSSGVSRYRVRAMIATTPTAAASIGSFTRSGRKSRRARRRYHGVGRARGRTRSTKPIGARTGRADRTSATVPWKACSSRRQSAQPVR